MRRTDMLGSAPEWARKIIEERGGIIRTSDALKAGIHPRTLYGLRDGGILEQMSRGIFHLATREAISNPDLVTVALRYPRAVICLVSALAFHGITTQIPHAVSIALEKGAESPRMDYPPLSVHRFSRECLRAGAEQHDIDGVTVQIYSAEKTLTDCFKFRNKIGMDIVLEALKLYRARKELKVGDLMKYARICRVEKIMKPYLEATL